MADIGIERKAPSVWPWVVGLVILALLVWALVEVLDQGTEPDVTESSVDSAGQSEAPPPPAAFPSEPPSTPAPADSTASGAGGTASPPPN